jgi:hypothetical protein
MKEPVIYLLVRQIEKGGWICYGIYPEFLKNYGRRITKEKIVSFFNDILPTSKLPKNFKRANVTYILKPGKDGTEPAHYRPISLLSVPYKLLEHMIL